MKVKIKGNGEHSDSVMQIEAQTEALYIQIGGNEYFIKEVSEGLYISEIENNSEITIKPRATNTIVLINNENRIWN